MCVFFPTLHYLQEWIMLCLLWKPSKALWLCLTHGRCGAGNGHRQCTVTACLCNVDNCPPLLPQVVLWGCSLGDLHSGLVGHSQKGRPRTGPLMLGVELPCACVLHPLHVCMSGVSAVSTSLVLLASQQAGCPTSTWTIQMLQRLFPPVASWWSQTAAALSCECCGACYNSPCTSSYTLVPSACLPQVHTWK